MSERPRLVGINHVALEVGDVEAAVEFYGRLFELGEVERQASPRSSSSATSSSP
jgi:catechol 2,3-dioxygenase-like lactoylglutathione lyase family enzyme